MNLCKCRLAPQVESSCQVDERLRGHDLDELHVLVFAEDPVARYWVLTLPELIFANGQKLHYQIGLSWQGAQERWFYTDCPIRNLLGCWIVEGSKVKLRIPAGDERPVLGRQAATVSSDDQGIHYQVSFTNTTGTPWRDVYTQVCFNCCASPATGYRPYVQLGQKWVPFQDIPGATRYCFLPFARKREEYRRTQTGSKLAEQAVSFPGIAAWNFVAGGPLLTCHYSQDALAVGSNQEWPCTDLYLWFGDIRPGETVNRQGHILIARTDIGCFAREAGELGIS